MFRRSRLRLKSLNDRKHDLDLSVIRPLAAGDVSATLLEKMDAIAKQVIAARQSGRSIVMMAGAHLIRAGMQHFLIDLMEKGLISCLALNGAGMIHDFELALIGATTESVARYIKTGEFGMWRELGQLNEWINHAYRENGASCMGNTVGREIWTAGFPHRGISLLAAGYRLNIPVTIHVSMGQDILHQQPNCDGAATGALSYNDFLRFAEVVEGLEGGAVLSFGSAVMAPEVFLKSLSMARNVAHQEGRLIQNFSVLVCDLRDLPEDHAQEPVKTHPGYYFRPWKTMLVRAVAGGGKSYYIRARHDEAVPALWAALRKRGALASPSKEGS